MSESNPYAAKSSAEPVKAQEVKELEAPKGTVSEVLAWVGDDKDKAKVALEAEQDGAKRVTLIRDLEEILNKE